MYRSQNDDEYDFNGSSDVPGTAAGRAPMSAYKPPSTSAQRQLMQSSMGRAAIGSRGGIPGSRMGIVGQGQTEGRPMTSVSGAGYKGNTDNNRAFDPLNIAKGHAAPLVEKSENSMEEKAKEMEKAVHALFEASAEALSSKDMNMALEKAKEAGKSERALCKFRESHGLVDQINLDLTFSIGFNLGNAYYHNKMYDDAINTYQLIIKNKQYPHSAKIRINLGNIYYDQRKYPLAIKMYRMAIDQIPSTGKELRCKIFRNIGNCFVKLGQFQDAIDSYEQAMVGSVDIQTAFNLLVCLYARGDKEKMKRHFMKMSTIPVSGVIDDEEHEMFGLESDKVNDTEKPDLLKDELSKRKEIHDEKILQAARLIAPVIDENDDWIAGYKWIMEQLRHENETVSSKLEIDLSMAYMSKGKFEDAIEVLKGFERKDAMLKAMAAINLSFIYFLEGDYIQAEKHADQAIKSDRYNAKGLVNKGNCLFIAQEFTKAKEMYLEAVGVEADCIEAIFNLGLVNLKLNSLQEAHGAFDKLHTILPSITESLFNLGSIYEQSTEKADLEQAAKTFEMLLSKVPNDANLCNKIAQIYERLEDDNTACHWQSESHRKYPVNLAVISWLGVWYVKREMYEQAIEYFDCASVVQPSEVKWRLMVASCYRRLGDLHRSLDMYKQIHEANPDNMEALQYLEAICKDLGRPHDEYSSKLDKMRRAMNLNTQQFGGATRMGAGTQQASQMQRQSAPPQRTERPAPQRSDRPERNNSNNNSGLPLATTYQDGLPNERYQLAAPQNVNGNRNMNTEPPQRTNNKKGSDGEDDDFADMDVGSLLG